MKDFAKLFTTPHGQCLVTTEFDDDEYKVSFRGVGNDACSPAVSFTFASKEDRDGAFDSVGQEQADRQAAEMRRSSRACSAASRTTRRPPMEKPDTSPHPMAWPFGRGVLVTATGEGETAGFYWIAAVPDGFSEADGKTAQEAWDRWRELQGPHVVLHFPTIRAVDRVIADLETIKGELWKQGKD